MIRAVEDLKIHPLAKVSKLTNRFVFTNTNREFRNLSGAALLSRDYRGIEGI